MTNETPPVAVSETVAKYLHRRNADAASGWVTESPPFGSHWREVVFSDGSRQLSSFEPESGFSQSQNPEWLTAADAADYVVNDYANPPQA